MSEIVTSPSIRIKLLGSCNRSCNFCNEEGDMRNIEPVKPNQIFFDYINEIQGKLGVRKVMLTGGEPLIYLHLFEIIKGINSSRISITTNGVKLYSVGEWVNLKRAGLKKVIVSIHDTSPRGLIQSERNLRSFGWAVRALESQKLNVINISEAGLEIRINTVAYHSYEQVLSVLETFEEIQKKYKVEIRILNNLVDVKKSLQIIKRLCQSLDARVLKEERKAGSSNKTTMWVTNSGMVFSTKMSFQYFFKPVCENCLIKDRCYEGFYGIRIEKKMSDYWVRLCIYKDDLDVLMSLKDFMKSSLVKELKNIYRQEQL